MARRPNLLANRNQNYSCATKPLREHPRQVSERRNNARLLQSNKRVTSIFQVSWNAAIFDDGSDDGVPSQIPKLAVSGPYQVPLGVCGWGQNNCVLARPTCVS